MLTPTSQASAVLWRRNLLRLGLAGALMTVTPAFTAASAAERERSARRDITSLSGRIFLDVLLKTKLKEGQQDQTVNGIIAVDPTNGQWEYITQGAYPKLSPDGRAIAFLKFSAARPPGTFNLAETWTYDLTTHAKVRALDDGRSVFPSTREESGDKYKLMQGHPICWSPDSRQIVASVGRHRKDYKGPGCFVARRVNRDGSDVTKLHLPETDELNDWSLDGQWFVTVSERHPPYSHGYQLYRMRPDGTDQLRLTKDGLNCYPRFSPDSRQIVYLHQIRGAGNSLYVIDVNGRNNREILHEEGLAGVGPACFSPDGRRLAVMRFNWQQREDGKKVRNLSVDTNSRIEIMDIDGTNCRELSLFNAQMVWFGLPDWR
jgi:Tol biopolymer transport system component